MPARFLVLFLAGALFGAGLAFSGMTDPTRVIGFLDVAGTWDPTLLLVMAGAVGTYGTTMWAWRRFAGGRGWFGTRLPAGKSQRVDWRLLVGAAIFGVGWGLGGFCPGPALANLAAWRVEALVFVPAMIAGMLLARAGFGADRD